MECFAGKVIRFFDAADRQYGFVRLEDGREVFFHLNDHDWRELEVPELEKGMPLEFEIGTDRQGRLKARNWRRWCPRIQEGQQLTVKISDLPGVGERDLEATDLLVDSVSVRENYYLYEWWDVIWRPHTGELFRCLSWDSEGSSYQPDLGGHDLPGLVVEK